MIRAIRERSGESQRKLVTGSTHFSSADVSVRGTADRDRK